MTIRRMTPVILAGVSLLLAPMASPALASGGGGGGGGGSASSGGGGGGMDSQYDPVVEYQRGVLAMQNHAYKDAVRAFEHVTDSQPRVASAWYALGAAQTGAGDVKNAVKSYQRSLKLDAGPVATHRELALSYVTLKQADKANAELAVLKARDATCAGTCAESAELKSAIVAVTAALAAPSAMNASPPGALLFASAVQGDRVYVRAVSLINERRFDEALTALDQAEAAIGPHPDILTYKGYVLRHLGQTDKAEAYYQQALAIAPHHRGATEYYGELKVLRGDMTGARAMLAELDQACTFGCAEATELRRWIDHGGDPAG